MHSFELLLNHGSAMQGNSYKSRAMETKAREEVGKADWEGTGAGVDDRHEDEGKARLPDDSVQPVGVVQREAPRRRQVPASQLESNRRAVARHGRSPTKDQCHDL